MIIFIYVLSEVWFDRTISCLPQWCSDWAATEGPFWLDSYRLDKTQWVCLLYLYYLIKGLYHFSLPWWVIYFFLPQCSSKEEHCSVSESLCLSPLQDQWEKGDLVHHRTRHQLCHSHYVAHQVATSALDQAWSCVTLSAWRLNHFKTHRWPMVAFFAGCDSLYAPSFASQGCFSHAKPCFTRL